METETNTAFDTAEVAREQAPEQPRGTAGTAMKPEERAELLAAGEAQELRSRWEKIQTGFVDEPRKSVQEADALVAQTTKQLAESFSRERTLEQEWDRGAMFPFPQRTSESSYAVIARFSTGYLPCKRTTRKS
jgi:hypothetical protein